ncbi:MAG TPA: mannosyltransferase family protein [Actinomycetota bacterium]|nr:mannosyltransferase family protein [Actinomycetota bacterium]
MRTEPERVPGASAGPAGAALDPDPSQERERILRAVRFCLLAFVGLRVAMIVIGVVGVSLFPPLRAVGVPGWPSQPLDLGWQNAFTAWERFDALWFLRIAEGGYRLRDGSAAFFPLYPLAIRGLSLALGGHPLGAATIVSNAAFWGGLVVTYLLTTSELSERTARTTVLLMCLFPTAHFFLMPYSESLFLLLSATAWWGARRRRWVVAGAAGFLAALTRSIGFVIAPALLIEALHQRGERRGPAWPGVLAAVATAGGLLAYLGSWGVRAGEWLAPVTFQANWERTFTWPWVTLWDGTGDALRYLGRPNGGYWLLDWLIVVPMLVASVYALVRLRPAYGVYLWSALLIPLTFVFPDRPLMSMPRFVLPLFPAFWGLALGLERLRIPRSAALAACALGLGVLSVLTVNWYYIF